MSSVSLKRALPPVYAAAAVRLLFPLLVLPVMAVRLGTDEFGRLGLMLVWAGLLAGGFALFTYQALEQAAARSTGWSSAA